MMKRIAFVLLVTLAAACSTPTPPPPPPAPPAKAPEAPPPPPPPPPPQPAPVAPPDPMLEFERMRAGLNATSVYFDFDKFAIRPDQTAAITDNAKVASTFSNDYVTLQGNCDERGSREYNVALGQRRADAVRQRLELLGVPGSRIETVSFGREKPRALCHNETCWHENRRTDFVHAWK